MLPTIYQEGNRSIIDKMDLHFGLKLPCLDGNPLFPQSADQSFVEVFSSGGLFRFGKGGPSPFSAIAIESKLRDD